jgi:hypothetical protein
MGKRFGDDEEMRYLCCVNEKIWDYETLHCQQLEKRVLSRRGEDAV